MKRKIGEGHLAAMGRLGLKELKNIFNPSRESVADQEIGLLGTATQGEIADARGGPGNGSEQESRGRTFSLDDLRAYSKQHSQADDRSPQQAKEQSHEQAKDHERGMER